MAVTVSLYSDVKGQINKFLSKFYNTNLEIENCLEWKKEFESPIEIAEIIGIYTDNIDDYKFNMWISLDKGYSINVSEMNANEIIKYLYERFPY